MNYNCLIIDDETELSKMTQEYFEMFEVSCATVSTVDECLEFLKENTADVFLLDINLGNESGFALCKQLREKYDTPILFISARQSDDDVLVALNIGGDDYIKKPYTLSILLAKVKTVLSRYEKAASSFSSASSPSKSSSYDLPGGITLDTNTHKLVVNGDAQSLKDMEYKLLLYLVENRGRVVTKDELLKNVWDDEFIGEGTIAVHIRHLREKTEKNPKEPLIIKTIWGVGYILDA